MIKTYNEALKDEIHAKRNTQYNCVCGAKPSLRNKARLEKAQVHKAYLMNQKVNVLYLTYLISTRDTTN